MSTITRKIFFYHLDIVDVSRDTSIDNMYSFFTDILRSERCNLHYPAEDCYVSIISSENNMTKCQLITSRKYDLPQVEESHVLTPLELDVNQGLANVTHFILFNNNVIGVEFNFYGPRINKLRNFVQLFYEDHYSLEIMLMTSEDVLNRIQHYGEIFQIDVQVRCEVTDLLEKSDNPMYQVLKGIREKTPADTLRFVGSIDRDKRDEKSFTSFVKPVLRKEILEDPEFREGTERFKIKARNLETDRIDEIDLLSDRLTKTKTIKLVDTIHRVVDSSSMFTAILDAYTELQDEINKFILK